jgi:hypothetical protein
MKVTTKLDFGKTSDKLNDKQWETLMNCPYINKGGEIVIEFNLEGKCFNLVAFSEGEQLCNEDNKYTYGEVC